MGAKGPPIFSAMKMDEFGGRARALAHRYRVKDGERFRLSDVDPDDTAWLKDADKPLAQEALQRGVEALASLQDMLYAQDRWGVLLIFQAMDAAGKDGTIKHVMSGINPQGCQVVSLQGAVGGGAGPRLPLAVRTAPARAGPHRHLQPLVLRGGPRRARPPGAAREAETAAGARHARTSGRSASRTSTHFERYLARNGIDRPQVLPARVAKEQKKRFLERIDDPRRTGSSPPPTCRSAASGRTTWRPTRT